MESLQEHYIRFYSLSFPHLGKIIGDFGLYDSLLAGTIDSYLKGKTIKKDDIPVPDKETISTVNILKTKNELSEEEKEFLLYFNELEAMRNKLTNLVEGNVGNVGEKLGSDYHIEVKNFF